MNYRAICAAGAIVLGSVIALAAEKTITGIVNVEVKTNVGTMVLELDADKAPKTVANFLQYVEKDHYAGTIFHRVIDGFMIQGGGLDRSLKEKPGMPAVQNEAGNGLKNDKYTVAMARSNDPNSATCQFFINMTDNGFLNRDEAEDGYGYTVFGRLVKGNEVADAIGKSPTRVESNPAFPAMLMRDVPVDPIVIESVRVLKAAQ